MLPLVLADLVDGDDVGVVQAGRRLRLPAEAPPLALGSQSAGQDHLQGHDPVGALLPRPVDDAHAAVRDLPQQLVITEGRGRRAGGRGGWGSGVGRRGSQGTAQGASETVQTVVGGEEGVQFRGQVRVAGQQVLPVGRLTGINRLQVGSQDGAEGAVLGRRGCWRRWPALCITHTSGAFYTATSSRRTC